MGRLEINGNGAAGAPLTRRSHAHWAGAALEPLRNDGLQAGDGGAAGLGWSHTGTPLPLLLLLPPLLPPLPALSVDGDDGSQPVARMTTRFVRVLARDMGARRGQRDSGKTTATAPFPHPMHATPPGPGETVSALAGDLTFVVGLSLGNEVLTAAREADLGQVELVAILLILTSLATATSGWVAVARLWLFGPSPAGDDGRRGLLGFVNVFGGVLQRLLLSTTAQVMTQTVVAAVPLRSVRVLSLCSITTFWVFLSSTLTVGRRDALVATDLKGR